MTLVEIARALGAQTVEEIARECGFKAKDYGIVEAAVRAEMVSPVLVLDYRGGDPVGRWARFAKPPLRTIDRPLGLDPVTGLKVEAAPLRRRRKMK